jgi:hypothetical protein
MAQYTQIVRSMQVFGRGKRKKTGAHLMYRTPALNHYLTHLNCSSHGKQGFIRED